MKKKFIQFFKIEFWPKNGPCGKPEGKKNKVFEKHKQGGHKKGHRKRDGKKMVMDGLSL